MPFIQTLPNLGLAALLLFGGNLALDGSISLGTLLAFNSYLLQLAAPGPDAHHGDGRRPDGTRPGRCGSSSCSTPPPRSPNGPDARPVR